MTTETLKAKWEASGLAGKNPRQLAAMERMEYRRLFAEEKARAVAGRPMSRTRAGELLLRYHGSYSRLPEIMRFASIMNRRSWLATLGEYWSVSDNLFEWDKHLRRLLPGRTTLLMMDKDERAAWQALPDVVTVYRGCSEVNLTGLSWSLSRDIAAKFPTQSRYMPPRGFEPLLVTGEVAKGRIIAVNLSRDEQEVITLHPRVTRVEDL